MLKIENLHVSYGGIQALRGVSLEVPDGKIVTLIGANGAGKSTTLRTITGLVKASSGSIQWNGEELLGKSIDKIVKKLAGTLVALTGRVGPACKIVCHTAMVPGHSGQVLVSGMPVAPIDDGLPFATASVRIALHRAHHSSEQIDTQPLRGVGQCTLQDGQGGIRAGRFGIKFVQMRTDETVDVGSGA